MAAAAVVLLLVLSMGMTKAGAQTADATTPPSCTDGTTVVTDVAYPPVTVFCPSDTLVLVLHDYEPGSVVTLHIFVDTNNDGIVEDITLTGIADANGDVVFEWDIPAGFAGDVEYASEGVDENGDPRTETGTVFVEDNTLNPDNGGDGGGGGPLPYTGSNSTNLVRIGLVLIFAGGISVVAVRRRNAHVDA